MAQIKCPQCGGDSVATILWGYPAFNDALRKKIDSGEIHLGGCIVTEESPRYHCNQCGFEFDNDKTVFDIKNVLQYLFSQGRVFCSEADFQFALAWAIKEEYHRAQLRLEFVPFQYNSKIHIDIAVMLGWQLIPIELKYKTISFAQRQTVTPMNHGAQDLGRYDFLSDVQRLEKFLYSKTYPAQKAYAVLLTNDHNYWQQPPHMARETIDAEFRIHEGAIISGERKWGLGAGAGTTRFRERPIVLRGRYEMQWAKPVLLCGQPFRYTVVEIDKEVEDKTW